MRCNRVWLSAACVAGGLMAFAGPASAACQYSGILEDLTISQAAANDIASRLAANQNVTIQTTANGACGRGLKSAGPGDIIIKAPIAWSTSATLTIESWHSITISKTMTVSGPGQIVIAYNGVGGDGALRFAGANIQSNGNHIAFTDVVAGNTQGALSINGNAYTLVNSLSQMSSATQANQSGYFALANAYDALGDGTYTNAPVSQFSGTFEGLGNTIARLKMLCSAGGNTYGVFGFLNGGTVRDIGIINSQYTSSGTNGLVIGGLVGFNMGGSVVQSFARGNMHISESAPHGEAGGLVGENRGGLISLSFASGTLSGGLSTLVGGLAGGNTGTIERSYANATVNCTTECYAGGLAGNNRTNGGTQAGRIFNAYALGSATAGANGYAGGLVGANGVFDTGGFVHKAYSTATVSGGSGTLAGGFIGSDTGNGASLSYWDTDTSGQSQGAGSPSNDPGITGLTTAQLQSGLPAGFDPAIWSQDPITNGGLPYLIDLRPH